MQKGGDPRQTESGRLREADEIEGAGCGFPR